MGRALAPVSDAIPLERYGKEAHNPFEALGFRMRVDRRGGKVFHQVSMQDSAGQVLAQHEQEVQFVIGSGTRTYSYLTNNAGYLSESPITWFSQAKIWALSPGFSNNYLAGRPVREPCLFCHCNHAEHAPGTENGYRVPIFTGYAIGCERCHGPGELHVAFRKEGGDATRGTDDSIVDPGYLEPVLRESVCEQCHLEGSNRIQRRGTQPFDYRPGLPLHRHLSVFLPSPEFGRLPEFVGQVEQMHASRCYQASNGKLGCISCHDPHAVPTPAERVGIFRARCLKCHKEDSCHIPLATRRQTEPEDSCIRCHMPRREAEDLPHAIVTDHRIPRNREAAEPLLAREAREDGMPLLYFHRDLVDERDPDVSRDLGVALMELAWASPELRRHACSRAVPLLEQAVRRWPDDAWAWEAKGKALWLMEGRQREALADVEKALSQLPGEERILEAAAAMATSLGNEEAARAYWERAIAVNPTRALFHVSLAQVLARRREWSRVRSECQTALRFDPFNADARHLQVTCLLQAGNKEQARAEFKILLALQPSRADELRRWFAERMR
jgi:hypothetical protein